MRQLQALLALFAVLNLTPEPADADVIWSADPTESGNVDDFFRRLDSGNYPQDYCVTRGDEAGVPSSSASVYDDAEQGKVWKIHKPMNRKRAEFARAEGDKAYYSAKEGDDIYIGWRWKISTSNQPIFDEVTVFQWKSARPHNQNYPIAMEYDGTLTLNAFGPDYKGGMSQKSRRTVLWRKQVPQDTWVDLVVRIKLSKDDFGGIVQFWFNGEQQSFANENTNKYKVKLSTDKKTVFHRTDDGSVVYPKWGVYNKKSCKYDASAYFADMKIGTTLASVM